MKYIVHLSGKIETSIEINDEDNDILSEENYPHELYSTIWNYFKDNDWEDICCDNIDYYTETIVCHVSVW